MTSPTPATEEDVHFVILMALKLDDSGRHRRLNAKMTGAEVEGTGAEDHRPPAPVKYVASPR
ncbi:hypothetical protein JCM15831A_11100 [Asaia astilbis]